jgi:hypothetical protein
MTVLTLAALLLSARPCADGGVVVVHPDADYSESGVWSDGGRSWDQRGMSARPARRSESPGAWARWTPDLPAAGRYRVWLWNMPAYFQDNAATIQVVAGGHTTTIKRDLRDGYWGWLPLGDFDFAAGAYVQVTRGDRMLQVDAARFQSVESIAPIAPLPPYPPADGKVPYLDRSGPTGRLMLGGKPYLMLGAELENGSALDPEDIPDMDALFDSLCEQRMNTIETPISWKQIEPTEGQFDFRVIDALIDHARARNMHLAILWFGTYKNLQSYYSPLWVIQNEPRFVRARDKAGKAIGTVSPFCRAALDADVRAFTALLGRIVERDAAHQVVLMVQVENEMPSWRDYGEAGQAAWNGAVPPELTAYLAANEAGLGRWARDLWVKHGRRADGTWAEVFGDDDQGARAFGAWFYSRFADQVAAAGKAVLPLPMYVNSWQGESPCFERYLDVAHAAMPHIDCTGPDLYLDRGFSRELDAARRPWDNVVVPETNQSTAAGARAWTAYGKYGALYFGSYLGPEMRTSGCRETFAILEQIADIVCDKKATDAMTGFNQEGQAPGTSWDEPFGPYVLHLTATDAVPPAGECDNLSGGAMPGAGMALRLGPDEVIVIASRLTIALRRADGQPLALGSAESGHFDAGRWVPGEALHPVVADGAVRLEFPRESGRYGQVRLQLGASAHP